MWWLELEQPSKLCGNLGTEVLNTEAKVQESWSTWWDRTSPDFWPCMFIRERNQDFFCWRTVIWDSNRKIILIDTGSHQKDLVPCRWLQKSTCYTHILSFTPQNNLTIPVHGKERETQEQVDTTAAWLHSRPLLLYQVPPTSPGEPRGTLDEAWGAGQGLDLLSCWEAKCGLEVCPVCLKGTLS